MAQAERPSGACRSMYAELPSPLNNFKCISGEGKPNCYEHRGPTEHLRRDYHHCRSYPLELRRGPFDRDVEFKVLNDDHPTGYYYHPGTGICMCNDPSSRLNAYARDRPYGDYTRTLPALPGRPWPQWDAWVSPYRRGRGKFYDWYYGDERKGGPRDSRFPPDGGKNTACDTPVGADMTHRELMSVQRPTAKVDTGYRSRWSFEQP
ncbi:hypothetical protein ACOMHN_054303 [Nucella lapillus]